MVIGGEAASMAKEGVRGGKLLEGWLTMVAGVGFGDFGQVSFKESGALIGWRSWARSGGGATR